MERRIRGVGGKGFLTHDQGMRVSGFRGFRSFRGFIWYPRGVSDWFQGREMGSGSGRMKKKKEEKMENGK